MKRKSILITLLFFSTLIFGQEKNKYAFRFQGDSRRTIINRKSVNIYGLRGGILLNNQWEAGIGVYSSNLFGLLGRAVSKDYVDRNIDPPTPLPAEIGFHYFSLYGEYIIIENNRWKFT
ncbi:MAG: hypothetical protein AAF573_15165, partial [Bacteroidota bacterium]